MNSVPSSDVVFHLHLLQHLGAVFGTRRDADTQLSGDLLHRLSAHKQLHHLAFAIGQPFCSGSRVRDIASCSAVVAVLLDGAMDVIQ